MSRTPRTDATGRSRPTGQAPSTGEPKTARTGRRLQTTGTVGDILTMLPPKGTQPVNGPQMPPPSVDGARSDTSAPDPGRMHVQVKDRDVENARAFISAAGVVPYINRLIAEAEAARPNHKPGRPARVPVEALLVAMWIAANTQRPMLLTEFRDILFHSLTDTMRNILNVSDGVTPRGQTPKQQARWDKTAADAVRTTFKKVSDVLDPSDEIVKRHNQMWDEVEYRGLTDQQMQQLHARLDWVSNQLLLVAYNTLPDKVRRKDNGDRCIDATPIRLLTRQRSLDDTQAMSMLHGANYVREEDHLDPDETQPPRQTRRGPIEGRTKRFLRKKTKSFPALDLHTLATADTNHPDRQYLPSLFASMTTDRSALDPAGAARRLFAADLNRGFQPGYLTGDGLYANENKDGFQKPAREAGFKLILPILKGASGVQGSHPSGFVWVDGTACCPAIPEQLRTVLDDYRNGLISHETMLKRLNAREKFQLMTKQNPNTNGVGERLGCRAADHSLSVSCCHKPNSATPRAKTTKDGAPVLIAGPDLRPRIALPETEMTNGLPPTICQKQWVTISPDDNAKYRQAIPVGDRHTDIYNRLRQSQEGDHGFAKDESKEAIGTPGRRRVKTKVAQHLFIAFMLAAANLRKIRTFLAKAVEDHAGDLYIPRTPRTGDHARTGNPPGAPPGETQAA